jgi:hypothetical protein
LAPKITGNYTFLTYNIGMLIDFTVFEITDVIEMLENEEEFNERVIEAIGLINTEEEK